MSVGHIVVGISVVLLLVIVFYYVGGKRHWTWSTWNAGSFSSSSLKSKKGCVKSDCTPLLKRGTVGCRGSRGCKGDTGRRGCPGPQGYKGKRGCKGKDGKRGPKGDTGAQGKQGCRGEIGNRGAQGPRGVVGTQGFTGPQGFTGFMGQQGSQGFIGSVGAQGPRGIQGVQGAQGAPPTSIIPYSTSGVQSFFASQDFRILNSFAFGFHKDTVLVTSGDYDTLVPDDAFSTPRPIVLRRLSVTLANRVGPNQEELPTVPQKSGGFRFGVYAQATPISREFVFTGLSVFFVGDDSIRNTRNELSDDVHIPIPISTGIALILVNGVSLVDDPQFAIDINLVGGLLYE